MKVDRYTETVWPIYPRQPSVYMQCRSDRLRLLVTCGYITPIAAHDSRAIGIAWPVCEPVRCVSSAWHSGQKQSPKRNEAAPRDGPNAHKAYANDVAIPAYTDLRFAVNLRERYRLA